MIDRQELLELAREFSLRPDVVEKDYALGWMLFGLGGHPALKDAWIFKGGTCLKKCYFETYRFSEDLDFTLTNPAHLNEQFLLATFREISERVYERSGLGLPVDTFKFEVFKNPRGQTAAQGRIGYRGPIAPGGSLPRIKLDLAHDEKLVLTPERRVVRHSYTDAPPEGIAIACYPYEEVFAEKLRALAERQLPRDLYDVIHLYRHPEMRPDRETIMRVLTDKCAFKGIPIPTMQSLHREPQMTELNTEWSNMLAHQLQALPPVEDFWQELSRVFDWLAGTAAPSALESAPAQPNVAEDAQWVPPSTAQAWGMRVPLEAIRFAGANHLCVRLGYQGTMRTIEPYSLRRTSAGRLLLHALRVDNREHRAYKVDEIESAEVLQQSFTPVYAVELTPAGPLHAPMQSRTASTWNPLRPQRRSTSGVKYVIECSSCGKRFTRSTLDTSLREHKDTQGYPCWGRLGYQVDTTYA